MRQPIPIPVPPGGDDLRFWDRVEVNHPLGCWLWIAGRYASSGYGYYTVGKRKYLAHRYAFTLLRGPIPATRQLDHLCRQRACVNPDHLEVVTGAVNFLRGAHPLARAYRYDRCSKDAHALTGRNVYTTPDGTRICRACVRRTDEARRRRAGASAQTNNPLALDVERVLTLFDQGRRPDAIALEFRCSRRPIDRLIKQHGRKPHRPGRPTRKAA